MLDKINSKLSIGARLAVVSGLFLASAGFVTALLAHNELENINFSHKEREGTSYLTQVWDALRHGAQLDASGAQAFDAEQAAAAFTQSDGDEARTEAGARLIAAIADGSNLTLDPELDSFYAMDAATVRIPALLSAAAELENAAASRGDEAQRTVMVRVAEHQLQAASEAAAGSLEAAAEHNASGETRAALAAPASSIRAAAAALIAASQSGAAADFRERRTQFEGTIDSAWQATAAELSRLLDARVTRMRDALMGELALVAIILALAGALAVLITMGLSRRFKALTATMDRLREGDFHVDVPYTADSHETGKIADTLLVLRNGIAERAELDARRLEEAQTGAAGLVNAISSTQAMVEFDPTGVVTAANENFLATMGYRAEEIIGKNHASLMPPEQQSSAEYASHWERLRRGEFISGKFLRVGKGGKRIWLQASYNPICDRSGKVVKVVKFATDISEAERIAAEALFKGAAFDSASVAMMMIDRDFKVTYVNESTNQLMRANWEAFRTLRPDFNPDKLVGSCIDIFHKNPAHQRQMLADPGRLPFRTDITVGDIKIQLNVSGIYDAKRNYVGNILEWENVTESRLNAGMLGALRRSQAIIEFAIDGAIQSANENFCRTMGYSQDELRGQRHDLFIAAQERDSAEHRGFWSKLTRGEFQAGKYCRIGKGGKEVWVQASYNPILDGNGKPFKIVMFADDITTIENERKHNEEERAAKAAQQNVVVEGLASGLRQLSEGDLTTRIETLFAAEYEQLRRDFNKAMEKLQDAMGSIVSNAGGIRTGASEITQAADDLSRRTEQQAASLEETAAALDEITATVKKTADGAKQANAVVGGARADAEASGQVVRETVTAMSEIEKSAKQISQIIGVIDEIAFQTNLLALNAGVEAARAGDAGRGFAVVASEVRALAQRSSEAAKEIKGLISTSSQHVETGVDLVGQAGKALEQIVGKVSEISALVSEIAASAQEQATGLAEVNTAINQMDQVTQQNAAMVQQSTAASHSLNQEAEQLMRLISRFQTGAETQAGAAAPKPAAAPRTSTARGGGETVASQQRRAAQFASTQGATALKYSEPTEDWEDF